MTHANTIKPTTQAAAEYVRQNPGCSKWWAIEYHGRHAVNGAIMAGLIWSQWQAGNEYKLFPVSAK